MDWGGSVLAVEQLCFGHKKATRWGGCEHHGFARILWAAINRPAAELPGANNCGQSGQKWTWWTGVDAGHLAPACRAHIPLLTLCHFARFPDKLWKTFFGACTGFSDDGDHGRSGCDHGDSPSAYPVSFRALPGQAVEIFFFLPPGMTRDPLPQFLEEHGWGEAPLSLDSVTYRGSSHRQHQSALSSLLSARATRLGF